MAYPGGNSHSQHIQFADAGGDIVALYDEDELDILRSELLEAYSTAREKMITRDQAAEIKRTEYAMQQTINLEEKKKKEESIKEELKGKQKALTRFYQSVLSDEVDNEGKRSRKKDKEQRDSLGSSLSYHEMYAVYHDPTTTDVADVDVDSNNEIEIIQGHTGGSAAGPGMLTPLKSPDGKAPTSREKSKFVLRTIRGKYSQPVPDEMIEKRVVTTHDQRRDMRYSKDHARYSFDVDVKGPFFQTVDPNVPAPQVREVATQVMLMDDMDRHSLSSGGYSYEEEEDQEEEQAGGDASSSNHSEEGEEEELKGKTLERKESKRREAETMARPRGYKDLDLSEEMPYLTFEAEIQVGGHDLDKEEALQMGLIVPKEKDNVLWPSCKEFDMDTISKKIEDYIKRCWTIDPKWLFMVQPLEVYHANHRKKYVFEVKFSIPSPTTPVPPATASVFFTFEIPIYSSKHEPVMVSYVLEGMRYAHTPGKIPFQDKWLWGIIADKLRIQKAVNF